jgi:hypothetical protein
MRPIPSTGVAEMLRPRSRFWILLALVVGIAFVVAVWATARAGSQDDFGKVRAAAFELARQAGDDNPSDASFVLSTRRKANRVLFDTTMVEANVRVYVVAFRGEFVETGPRPSGTAAATGRYLTVLVDASSAELLDHAVSTRELDISRLGSPVPLQRP